MYDTGLAKKPGVMFYIPRYVAIGSNWICHLKPRSA